MGRSRKGRHSQNYNRRENSNGGTSPFNDQQHRQNQEGSSFAARQRYRHPLKWTVIVLLENGQSFEGTAVCFDNPNMAKSKVFFKSPDRRELCIATDVILRAPGAVQITMLQKLINEFLVQLHEEANMEFPAWLEKHSTRVNESNPFFNLDEIREEYKFKQSRFGIWRIAARIGFFSDTKPQVAKLNRIMHLELREFAIKSIQMA